LLGLRPLTCPKCQGVKIRRRSTFLSFSLTLGLFLLLALLTYLQVGGGFFHLRVFIVLAAIFAFAAVLAAGISALLGRNRCMECGHRWR
jgi:hypothetical protein